MEHEKEQAIKQAKEHIEQHATELMVLARYYLGKAVNDEMFDTLHPNVQGAMLAAVLGDAVTDFKAEPFKTGYVDKVLNNDEPYSATAVYIYCNWRVWATYQTDKKLAQEYQAVCDKMDDYIFEHWSKEDKQFFIQQTD